MFYVSSINGSSVGVTDTYDNVEEFYTPSQIKEISKSIKVKGVLSRGIKKVSLGEALLTREIVEKIDCKKALSFEVVDDNTLAKYRLLGGKVINDNFMVVEIGTSIKLVSTKIIMLDNTIFNDGFYGLFQYTNFTKIDFHNTNTSNVKTMQYMFRGSQATSLDLSSFDTSNVKNMGFMFKECQVKSLNLSNFDTSNVKCMYCMFMNCQVTSLNLSSFDTSNVKNMGGMFGGCQATPLDLSNFNTSSVNRMDNMFCSCQATSLDLSSFDTSNVEDMDDIFENYIGTIKTTDARLLQAYNSREAK